MLRIFKKRKTTFKFPTDMAWTMNPQDIYYERGVDFWICHILQRIKPKPNFYDIGANFGYYSVKYHKHIKHGYAFEPVKNTFSFLSDNIRINRAKNITPLNYGLSDNTQDLAINIYNCSGCNTIHNRNIPIDHQVKKIGTEWIELKVLDELVNSHGFHPPSIIKIDVEGAELQVLRGAKKVIAENTPIVVFEFSENTSTDAGYERRELLDFFDKDLYTFKGINANERELELISYNNFGRREVGNVIAYPINKAALFK